MVFFDKVNLCVSGGADFFFGIEQERVLRPRPMNHSPALTPQGWGSNKRAETPTPIGRVRWSSIRRRYCFITRDDRCGEVVVHHSEIQEEESKALFGGRIVGFETTSGAWGPQAVNAVLQDDS